MPLNRPPHASMTAVSVAEGARKCFAMPPLSAIASVPSAKPFGAQHGMEPPCASTCHAGFCSCGVGLNSYVFPASCIDIAAYCVNGQSPGDAVLARLGEEHALCRHFCSDAPRSES